MAPRVIFLRFFWVGTIASCQTLVEEALPREKRGAVLESPKAVSGRLTIARLSQPDEDFLPWTLTLA